MYQNGQPTPAELTASKLVEAEGTVLQAPSIASIYQCQNAACHAHPSCTRSPPQPENVEK
eukprot:697949-Amphidinium_carterae.1